MCEFVVQVANSGICLCNSGKHDEEWPLFIFFWGKKEISDLHPILYFAAWQSQCAKNDCLGSNLPGLRGRACSRIYFAAAFPDSQVLKASRRKEWRSSL